MNRRKFLTYIGAGTALAGVGGYTWLSIDRDHTHLAIDLTLEKLEALDPGSTQKSGEWNVARTFDHLAQSIDFSMRGYPEQKSELFQNTVGKLAFNVFQARGKMNHNLAEAIPGEQVATGPLPSKQALDRLKATLVKFQQHEDLLKPHFVFGQLNKDEYALAHVMHINNHLEEFKLT